jgi:hypothetical protein
VRDSVSAAFSLRGLLELDPGDLAKGFMLLTHDQRAAVAAALAAAVFGAQAGPPAMSSLDELIGTLDGHLTALKRLAIRDVTVTAGVAEQAAVGVDKAVAPVLEAL